MTERSRWILDIERDLRLITDRLHALEDYFEDDGLIARLAATVHQLALDLETLKARRAGEDAD